MSKLANDDTHIIEKEVTLKNLVLKFRDFYVEIVTNWKILVLFAIPFIAFFLTRAFATPLTYPSSLTFMVNEDEGGGFGGAMAILSQFGFSGARSNGKYNLDKILELSKTRKIVKIAIFEKVDINDKLDFLANHIIDAYHLVDQGENNNDIPNFKFTHAEVDKFTLEEKIILKQVYALVIGNENTIGIYTTSINEDTGIMTLSIYTVSEQLTIELLNSIYRHLSQYYVGKSIEKQEYTYNVVKEKVDSVKKELNKTEYKLANYRNSHRGVSWSKTASIEEQQIDRNLQILGIIYVESIKNLEIAEFSLKSKTPFIQLIDAPLSPLLPEGKSKIKAFILGGLLGGFLGIGFIIARKIIVDSLKEES